MARVWRLAGTLIAETGGSCFVVGNPKVPCDWAAAGFAHPGELDAVTRPFAPLAPIDRPPVPSGVQLALELEGRALPELLAAVFLIQRTGSVSERLWRLVTGQGDDDDAPDGVIAARWLAEAPPAIFQIVRDAVLRCS